MKVLIDLRMVLPQSSASLCKKQQKINETKTLRKWMCPYFLLAKQFKKISISVLEYIQVFAFI